MDPVPVSGTTLTDFRQSALLTLDTPSNQVLPGPLLSASRWRALQIAVMLTLTRAIAYTWTALPTLLIRLAQAVPTSHPLYKRDGLLPSSYIQPKLHRSRDSISKLSQGSIQYMIDHTPAVDDGNIF